MKRRERTGVRLPRIDEGVKNPDAQLAFVGATRLRHLGRRPRPVHANLELGHLAVAELRGLQAGAPERAFPDAERELIDCLAVHHDLNLLRPVKLAAGAVDVEIEGGVLLRVPEASIASRLVHCHSIVALSPATSA